MKMRAGMAVIALVVLTIGSATAEEREPSSKHFFLDKNGGGFEVRANDPKDTQTRDAVRQQLRKAAADRTALSSPAVQQHQKELNYRYEQTDRGGRIRIIAKNRDALRAVQDFLHSQMRDRQSPKAVAFTFIRDTSLVAVPVM